ncbi:MAG: RNA 2',3'-cyclic phosphodiesterase [Gemmataceae bacterium]
MSRVRTFIALDLGQEIRARLVTLQETLGRSGAEVKWVEPENLHITLLFLGEVDQRDLNDVCRAVQDAAGPLPSFPASIEKVGAFPNLRRPRTLWVGVGQGERAVIDVHDALERPLLELGCYRREERKYTPHVTLGRVKSEKGALELETALRKKESWQGGETTIGEVHVMSSELTRDGPIYTVLSRARLGG